MTTLSWKRIAIALALILGWFWFVPDSWSPT